MPYDARVIKWADEQLEVLLEKVSSECILCDLIKDDKNELINYIYQGKKDENLKTTFREYRKQFRKENPTETFTKPNKYTT